MIVFRIILGMLVGLWAGAPAWAVEPDLVAQIEAKATTLSRLHVRASQILVKIASERFLELYFDGSPAEQAANKFKLIEFLQKSQSQFRVEEMCLIDRQGREIVRIVGGDPDSKIDHDESKNAWFKPGFAKEAKQVHVSPLYLSPDADRWVAGYTTPVFHKGSKPAILHYEFGLSVFQETARAEIDAPGRVIVLLDRQGRRLADSRQTIGYEAIEGKTLPDDYFPRVGDFDADLLAQILKGGSGEKLGLIGAKRHRIAWQQTGEWILAGFEPAN